MLKCVLLSRLETLKIQLFKLMPLLFQKQPRVGHRINYHRLSNIDFFP